ncbi:hypothetical protein OIA45_45450 (plasmid) [Streptomyces chartreusis]|uniref:hypothetical protein n=1 Tax=Streptomyces chartreusis TaxID=1969 RepID=UPI003867D802|nr:hypothetical protein OIA45_45450 [Streptomyces chartreusis]
MTAQLQRQAMLLVGQGLHEFGAAQGGLGVVLELQDPPLPQLRFVSCDDMGDGDGVEEPKAAQQPAGEPGGVPPDGFTGDGPALDVPLLLVGGPGVAGQPAGFSAVALDLLGEGCLGLLEGALRGAGDPDAGRLSEPAQLDAVAGACADPDAVESVDLVVCGAHRCAAGQQPAQQAVEAAVALHVEPDAMPSGLHAPDTEGVLEEGPLGAEDRVEHLGLEEELRLPVRFRDEGRVRRQASDDLARELSGSTGVEGVGPDTAAGLGGRQGFRYLLLSSVGPRSVRNRHWRAALGLVKQNQIEAQLLHLRLEPWAEVRARSSRPVPQSPL